MSINNINGINSYYSALLNQQGSQNSYGQSQDSLFGNNILTSNANNFNSATQNNSNSLLQMLLPLLINLLTGQQNTQASSTPVISAKTSIGSHQNTKKSGINNARKDRLSVSVNNSKVKHDQTVKNNQAVNVGINQTIEGEWLRFEDGSKICNNYTKADHKLVSSTKYEYGDKGRLSHSLSDEYDANEKLKKSIEYTKTPGQEITDNWLVKFYDQEGNITRTNVRTRDANGIIITKEIDKEGNAKIIENKPGF